MGKSDSTLIAIGGGELAEATAVLNELISLLKKKDDPRIVVITVATSKAKSASDKYNSLFRGHDIKHVETVDIEQRDDAFNESSLKKVRSADAIFFTGGDQLNVTTLLGGSPIHNLMHDKFNEGTIIAGTSAGAAMMSSSMITSGGSGNPPVVGGVKLAPGMGLVEGSVIDTHFSQRSRHGRLLTAIAHHPQALGFGIDERTAMVIRGNEFKVFGEGVVTVFDGSQMRHSDLTYRKEGDCIGMFATDIHVLPAGYKFNLKTREPIAPKLKALTAIAN